MKKTGIMKKQVKNVFNSYKDFGKYLITEINNNEQVCLQDAYESSQFTFPSDEVSFCMLYISVSEMLIKTKGRADLLQTFVEMDNIRLNVN